MNPQEQAYAEKRMIVGPLTTPLEQQLWEEVITLESQLAAKSWPQIKVEAINAMEIQAQELIRRAEKAELALSQAQASNKKLREVLADLVGIEQCVWTGPERVRALKRVMVEVEAALKEGE